MAAMPGTISITCPACDEAIALPISMGLGQRDDDGNLTVRITTDPEPVQRHVASSHAA